MAKVHYFPQADIDLAVHTVYLAANWATRDAAVRFAAAVEDTCEQLAEYPGLGSWRGYLNPHLPTLRMLPIPDFPKYLIYYREVDDGIEVLRILHSSQNIESILND